MGNFGSIRFIVHQQQIHIPRVVYEKLFESIWEYVSSLNQCLLIGSIGCEGNKYLLVTAIANLGESKQKRKEDTKSKRTLGIGDCPLNRRRTRLSIPFGFLQDSFTLLYRSDWCRLLDDVVTKFLRQ
jgi:hypothetical protein